MVQVEDHVPIPLSDGTTLSARIWFPATPEPCPAILEYHPYPKRYATAERDEIAHGFFAERGYVSLRVDMRGSGDSEGVMSDEYRDQERADALEVIAWIAEQPWCSGRVAMYGLSWGGFNSLQLAAMAPPALKAVAVAGATDDRYREDVHFLGGVMASEHIGWAATLLSFLTRPPDPAVVGRGWRQMWRRRLEALDWVLPDWLAHPARDEFWTAGFPAAAAEGLRVPTLVAGGTADVFATSVLRMVARQPELVKGIIGPWAHRFPHLGTPGPAIDWLDICTRWFDRWLKGQDNGAEWDPPLRVFVTDGFSPDEASDAARPGRWFALTASPEAGGKRARMALGRDGRLAGKASRARVIIRTPPDLGAAGGEIMPMGWGADLPGDQREDDCRSLCFESDPLGREVVVLGQASVTLRLSHDDPEAFCVARLSDVAPEGPSSRIALGAQKLNLDDSFAPLPAAPPGKPRRVTIALGAVAHRFQKGHRIRLALSNSYWPMLWPAAGKSALVLDLSGAILSLPLLPADAVTWHGFGPADGCPPLPRSVVEPATFQRVLSREIGTGKRVYRVTDVAAQERSEAHGLETLGQTTRIYSISDVDPAGAAMAIRRGISVRREDWEAATEVEVDFAGNAKEFAWDVRLTARHNGRKLLTKRYRGRQPRRP